MKKAIVILCLVGCFNERTDYKSGELACSRVGNLCPGAMVCQRDGLCHNPGEVIPDGPIRDAPLHDGPIVTVGPDAGCVPAGGECGIRACGFVMDRCGNTINCGTMNGNCPSGRMCDGTGQCVADNCTPLTQCPTGDDCGSVDKGCGQGPLVCGSCPASKPTCVVNTCTCILLTCPANSCGSYSNGCGGFLNCGDCSNNQTCDLGLCRDKTIAEACTGRVCGPVTSGGSTYSCPPGCTLPQSCGGAGVPGQCGCTPTVSSCPAMANCGSVDDGCGHPIVCGPATCSGTGESCGGGGTPNQCGCTDDGTACAFPCETGVTNCGQQVTCGPTCSQCEQCTATGCADPNGCCCTGHFCECGICVPSGVDCP